MKCIQYGEERNSVKFSKRSPCITLHRKQGYQQLSELPCLKEGPRNLEEVLCNLEVIRERGFNNTVKYILMASQISEGRAQQQIPRKKGGGVCRSPHRPALQAEASNKSWQQKIQKICSLSKALAQGKQITLEQAEPKKCKTASLGRLELESSSSIARSIRHNEQAEKPTILCG